MSAVLWNPIVTKEVRSRMRTWRAPVVMVAFLTVLAAVGYAAYHTSAPLVNGTSNRGQVGLAVFAALSATVMVLVALIVPGLVGGAVSGERERQTLDLLLVTPVGPARIIAGKLASALLFVLLLVVAALPLFSVVFILGGVELGSVIAVVVVTLVTALTLGGLSMLCSVVLKRTTSATVSSYIAGFLLFFGPLVAGALVYSSSTPQQVSVFSTTPGIAVGGINRGGIAFSGPAQPVPLRQPQSSGPPSVILASPATAMFGAVANGFGTRTICATTGMVNQVTPGCTSTNTGIVANDTMPDGIFGGWKYWQASSLIDGVIAALAIAWSVLVLRGRRLRRRAVGGLA
jgi:ABC-type transport system involved in multi-copper enzyme maturation permease subunit